MQLEVIVEERPMSFEFSEEDKKVANQILKYINVTEKEVLDFDEVLEAVTQCDDLYHVKIQSIVSAIRILYKKPITLVWNSVDILTILGDMTFAEVERLSKSNRN